MVQINSETSHATLRFNGEKFENINTNDFNKKKALFDVSFYHFYL